MYANKRDGPHKLAMWSLFDLFDTSGDGKINIDELILGLSMHCYGTMEQKVTFGATRSNIVGGAVLSRF